MAPSQFLVVLGNPWHSLACRRLTPFSVIIVRFLPWVSVSKFPSSHKDTNHWIWASKLGLGTLSTAEMLSFAEGKKNSNKPGITKPTCCKSSSAWGKQCYVKSANMLV